MPRLQPPQGYYTASEAKKALNVSDAVIRSYVQRGMINYVVPPNRKQGFYLKRDVDSIVRALTGFLNKDKNFLKSHIKPVETLEEMQECIDIANIVFDGTDDTPMSVYEGRIKANPLCYHMVISNGQVVGFVGMVPLREGILSEVLAQTIPVNISNNNVVAFKPDTVTEIYISVMVTRPNVPDLYRHIWGAGMIRYLIRLIENLGHQGITIKTIGARSAMLDGIKLLQHFGFTEIKRTTPERRTFIIEVEKSGIPFIERYQEALNKWRQKHKEVQSSP